jgi:hypothetical protein
MSCHSCHSIKSSFAAVAGLDEVFCVRQLALPVLRHRLLVNYRAEAEGVTIDQVISRLIEHVPGPVTT